MSNKQNNQEKKLWKLSNVFSAWMATFWITLIMWLMSQNEFFTKATGIAIGVVALSMTVEYIMKKRF